MYVLKEQMTLPRGFTIRDPSGNRYLIEGILGKGGSSAVYLIRERSDKERVFALKEIIDPDRREREHFIFEWEVLKRLQHPGLPEVYSVFEHQKLRRVYILMTYVKGSDLERLRAWQPDKRFSLSMALALMRPIVAAVGYLHAQNPPVVHRDIKPSNIIVPTGSDAAVLVDFSIAKEYVPNSTTTAIRHGSPGYAAPEQYGTGTTPLTDVYGLGATFYTLLTGAVPTDALTRLTEGKKDPLRSLKDLVLDIPVEVSEVVKRAMSLNREDRFSDVEQFWQAFSEAAGEKPAASSEITGLATGELTDIQLHPIDEIITIFTHREDDIPVVRGRKVPLALFAVFLIGLLAASVLYFSFYARGAVLHPIGLATAIIQPTHPPTPTPFPTFSPYPALASVYKGTSDDITTDQTAPLQLDIQQTGGNIAGFFQGLGLSGSFKGTIDISSNISFTVPLRSRGLILVFSGNVQTGGLLHGTFAIFNLNGQKTGEEGTWQCMVFKY
jgi:eukaryotic-like serine/threonine-protein kinase